MAGSGDPADDPFDLRRFLGAQDPVIDRVRAELRQGRKASHWMWFVFPQLKGLGRSAVAEHYGIASLDEARAYLDHPILGARLRECARLVNAVEGRAVGDILGYPDDLKFRSCMSLFAEAAPDEDVFRTALAKYFRGEPDPATLALLRPHRHPRA